MQLSIDEFLTLRSQLPVIDVRSEGEFHSGHIPLASNIPILNNDERIEVGTAYKQKGQTEAIHTGFRLVGPRLSEIIEETEKAGSELLVHCWRGGMRSANFCQFAAMARIKTHQLAGGYKAYRVKANAAFAKPLKLMVIAGCTGSGKTEILHALKGAGEQIIDLEGLASHKGSVFGGLQLPPQPTSEQFQNQLFEVINAFDVTRRIWVEDESIAIGNNFLPPAFWNHLNDSPVVEIEVSKDVRINRLVAEYGTADRTQFLDAMTKLTRKLGGQHFNAAREMLREGNMAGVIDILLTYYDKAYLHSLEKKQNPNKHKINWDGTVEHDIISSLQTF